MIWMSAYFPCIKKNQSNKTREEAESGIFSLVSYDLFDGIVILTNSILTPGVLEKLEEDIHENYDGPVVFVDRESKYFPSIITENYTPIKTMISHLIEKHGYTDIAFLTGHPLHPHSQQRLQGFLDCMKEHGFEVPKERIFYGDFWYNSGASTARQLLRDRRNLPQAVACANDYMAIGLIAEFEKAGIRVPDDVAVTGYDNIDDGKLLTVPLSSVSLPAKECGEHAVKWIIALLSGGELEEFEADAGISIGMSCGCLPVNDDDKVGYDPQRMRARAEYFDFNVSTMEDDLLMQSSLSGVVNTIFYYVNQIRPFTGFHLCLNSDWKNDGVSGNIDIGEYSDKMLDVLKCGLQGKGEDRVDLEAAFDRSQLLPELGEDSEIPRAYFFTPLFFEERCFGYAAINYGQDIRCYDADYKKWLGKVMHGLECFRRFMRAGYEKSAAVSEEKNMSKQSVEEDAGKMAVVADILDNNRLTYFFQPIVSAYTGDILAYEALMRSDTKEPVSPLDILKYAEKAGRLNDVERATFMNVLAFYEEHADLFGNKKVFINSIPGTEVSAEDSEAIHQKMQGLSGRVVVELTEQAEVDDEGLDAIKKKYEKLGVETAIDDYGTGYANVYNLLRYMPDYVKVDRVLMTNIHIDSQKQHFVKEIIEFCHDNQIAVLAEGVETAEELKTVIVLGVDLIQGYYTARPNASVVDAIDSRIQNEIIQYGQYAVEKSQSEIYRAGQEDTISLIKLVSAHYSKIIFKTETPSMPIPHRDVSIVGLQGFKAGVEIEIEDGYTGRIELTDVDFDVRNERPVIKIGENCDVTLVLIGENIFEEGGILVPESSKLTIQGDGNLNIKKIAINGSGIGNDRDSRHGDLFFEQDGKITIQGNTVCGIGIGSGLGGKIHISRGLYSIQIGGKVAVGIGTLYADTDVYIQNCGIEFIMRCAENVGLGSLKGNVVLDMSYIGLNAFFGSSNCVCIGSLEGRFDLSLTQATIEINAHAARLSAIGSLDGDTVLSMNTFSLKMTCSGDEAVCMGNCSGTAEISVIEGDIIVETDNELDYDIGAAKYEHINGLCDYRHNGIKVDRRSQRSGRKKDGESG